MKARDCLLGCLILSPHVLVVAWHVSSFSPKIRHGRSAPSAAAMLGSQQQQHASRCGHMQAIVQESPGEEAVAYGTDAAPNDAAQWPYDWRKQLRRKHSGRVTASMLCVGGLREEWKICFLSVAVHVTCYKTAVCPCQQQSR
ncbi:unnamed protein product [Ectocarpus sp. 8 AP-2014]